MSYYPGQKNRYSREIHEVDLQFDHVISCDIERRFDIDATCGICASRVVLQIEVDVAWFLTIALRINLMNISAVTIFLARVVQHALCLREASSRSISLGITEKYILKCPFPTFNLGTLLFFGSWQHCSNRHVCTCIPCPDVATDRHTPHYLGRRIALVRIRAICRHSHFKFLATNRWDVKLFTRI